MDAVKHELAPVLKVFHLPGLGEEMKRGKKLLFSLLCFAIVFGLTMPISPPAQASLATIYVPDDYATIQAAVDAANPGDTIIVRDGTYVENMNVNKGLIIQSENGAASTTVKAANSDDHVFELTAEYINIQGFTVKGATGSDKAGIYLDSVNHCEISNNIVLNNDYSVYLINSSYNKVADNTVRSCVKSGIILDYQPTPGPYLPPDGHNDPDNQWKDESLGYDENRNTYARVYLSGGMDSSPLELLAPSGKPTEGIRFWGSGGPLDVDIYYDGYWHCLRDWPWGISSAPANEWVELTYPSKIVEKARIKFHGRVLSGWSYLNEFQFKTVLDISCSNNDIIGNTVSDSGAGIRLSRSSNNRIYLNNFINNIDNGYSSDSSNLCNSPEQITYTYHGNAYTNYLGNYWNDYAAYLLPVGHNNPGTIYLITGDTYYWQDEALAYDGNIETYAKVWVGDIQYGPWLELFAPPTQSQGIRFWLGPWINYGGWPQVELFYDGTWNLLKDWGLGSSTPPVPKEQWVEIDYPEKMVEKARFRYGPDNIGSRGNGQLHEFQFKTTPADVDNDGIWDTAYGIDRDADNYPLVEPFENYEMGPAPNEPPVADAEPDYAYIQSGTPITFDGSHSYDPDGTIVSYQWDFRDGESAAGCHVSHRFRGAMNEPKDYDVTLTVQDNMGAIDTDTVTITVTPLEKTVPLASESGEVFAQMTAFYNWVQVIEGEDIYVVSKIDFEGERFRNYLLLVWDEYNFPVAFPAWTWGTPLGILMPVSETFTYPFGTYRDWADTVGNETFEGLAVYSYDRMELHAFSVELAIPELEMRLSWDGAYCYFDPSSHEVFPSTGPILWSIIGSPAELRVYDSQGRVTGLVNGEVKEEIPYSTYGENIIMILPSYDSYTYEVEGTDKGSYGLGVASVEDGESTTFTAIDIPMTSGAIHQYTIDWDALSQDEEGVTLEIDADGDGVFEETITSDATLQPPEAEAGGLYVGVEGSAVTFDGSGSFDPDGSIALYEWDFDGDGTYDVSSSSPIIEYTYGDDSTGTMNLRVTDDDGLTSVDTGDVTVTNVVPTVGNITAPLDPVSVNTPINTSGNFTDPGFLDTHTATWDWGDESTSPGTVTQTAEGGNVTGSHTYGEAGVYTVTLTVTDDDGGAGTAEYQYVVVYDPDGGFVSGGGWINSQEGAYAPDPELAGKATFGFVSKYKKGATVPTGQTEFQFKVADLNFHSSSYDWLVIAGPKAMYKGTGTINGEGNYGFMLSAIDEKLTPSTDVDMFRIKIWDKDDDDTIAYDNMMEAADDADPATEIGGGSIVIHKQN